MTILLTVKEYFRATYIRFLHLLQIFCQIHLHVNLRLVVLQIRLHLLEHQSLLLIKENIFVRVLNDIDLKLLPIVQMKMLCYIMLCMKIVVQGHIEIARWVINTRSSQIIISFKWIIDQQWFVGLSTLFLNLYDLIDLMTPLHIYLPLSLILTSFTFLLSFLRKPWQIWCYIWIYSSFCFLSCNLLF